MLNKAECEKALEQIEEYYYNSNNELEGLAWQPLPVPYRKNV